jgi:hypothetical protein
MAARKPGSTTVPSRLVPNCATWIAGMGCALALGCLNPLPEEVPSNQAPDLSGAPVTEQPAPGQELGPTTSGEGEPVDGPPNTDSPNFGGESEAPRDCEADAGTSECSDDPEACSRCDAGRDAQP